MNRWLDTGWMRAVLLLLIAAPPLYVGLGSADCEYHMEVMTLASAQETWLRSFEDPLAWRIPSWNGAPRVNKPPLTVWLHLLAWLDLNPARDTVDALVLRARVLSATLGLLTLFAVWSIGARLQDDRFGWLAAVITGTSLLFLRNIRIATYDAYLLSFSTFAVAAALHAIRPREPATGFWISALGWSLCGLFMAAAYLTKGPIALVMTLLPLTLIAAFQPNAARSFRGLIGAVVLAAALTAPWYLYVLHEVPEAVRIMGSEYKATRTEFQPPWYYFGLVGLIAPWSLWLVAVGVKAARKRLDWRHPAIRIAGLWFLAIFIFLSIPAAKQQRYIIPILPAAGLLMASLFSGVGSGPREYWMEKLARAHGHLLTGVSVLVGFFGVAHPWLVERGLLKQPELTHLTPFFSGALAIALGLLARSVTASGRRGDLPQLAMRTAWWMTIAATPLLYDYAHSHHGRYLQREQVENMMSIIGDEELQYAESPDLPDTAESPDGKMLLYTRRIIPLWTPDKGAPDGYLMAAQHEELKAQLETAGWKAVQAFHDGNMPRFLYQAVSQSPR